MKSWLASEYAAVFFEDGGEVAAYALYRQQPEEIYLRQLFVVRHRRREGIGAEAVKILRSKIWPANQRLTVEVLVQNEAAVAFWRAAGYQDYSLKLEILPEINCPPQSRGSRFSGLKTGIHFPNQEGTAAILCTCPEMVLFHSKH